MGEIRKQNSKLSLKQEKMHSAYEKLAMYIEIKENAFPSSEQTNTSHKSCLRIKFWKDKPTSAKLKYISHSTGLTNKKLHSQQIKASKYGL